MSETQKEGIQKVLTVLISIILIILAFAFEEMLFLILGLIGLYPIYNILKGNNKIKDSNKKNSPDYSSIREEESDLPWEKKDKKWDYDIYINNSLVNPITGNKARNIEEEFVQKLRSIELAVKNVEFQITQHFEHQKSMEVFDSGYREDTLLWKLRELEYRIYKHKKFAGKPGFMTVEAISEIGELKIELINLHKEMEELISKGPIFNAVKRNKYKKGWFEKIREVSKLTENL